MTGLLGILLAAIAANAQVEFLPGATPQVVFAGESSVVQATLRNPGSDTVVSRFATRLVQLSASTRMPVGDPQPWKSVQVLPGQTILESMPVSVPEVRAVTRFQVEIISVETVVARYPLLACPRDLLNQVMAVSGAREVGIFDPEENLRPLLQAAGVGCVDIESSQRDSGESYALAIFGPFTSREHLPADLFVQANELTKRNIGVIALLPPGMPGELSEPLQITMAVTGGGKVSTVFSEAGANSFGDSAVSQLTLLRMAELALGIRPPLQGLAEEP